MRDQRQQHENQPDVLFKLHCTDIMCPHATELEGNDRQTDRDWQTTQERTGCLFKRRYLWTCYYKIKIQKVSLRMTYMFKRLGECYVTNLTHYSTVQEKTAWRYCN